MWRKLPLGVTQIDRPPRGPGHPVSRWRQLAPAGTPIGASALLGWAARLGRGGRPVDDLAAAVQARQGVHACVPVATGRAGLVLLLRALARRAGPARDEVAIPSYTCYTVAAAAVVAGLRPRVVDVDPETLDFSEAALDAVDFSRVLAIVPTNLFGLPSNLPALAARARAHDVFLVDDAAQALGAAVGGRASGTWGAGRPVFARQGQEHHRDRRRPRCGQ